VKWLAALAVTAGGCTAPAASAVRDALADIFAASDATQSPPQSDLAIDTRDAQLVQCQPAFPPCPPNIAPAVGCGIYGYPESDRCGRLCARCANSPPICEGELAGLHIICTHCGPFCP
jgi:hypothetical protein